MDVLERLNNLRLEKNMSVYRLAELSGINQSTLANTFSRRTVPSIKNLELICEALGTTLSQFFYDGESTEVLSANEKELLESFRKLPPKVKESFTQNVKAIADSYHN